MRAWTIGVVTAAFLMGAATTSRAAKEQFDVGEEVSRFTLKVINTDVVKVRFVGIDQFFGPEAKEPKKAILLSFFATYCEPCKREMPFLAALHDLYKDKGLAVVSVSIDKEPDKIEFVKTLAQQSNVKFPLLSDNFNIVAKRFFVSKLPCVYLIDGDGKVAWVNVGYNDDASKAMVENIRKAMGEPTTDPIPEALTKLMAGHTGESVVDAAGLATKPTTDTVDGAAKGTTKTKIKGKGAKAAKAKRKKK